jgi:hypothetical protein
MAQSYTINDNFKIIVSLNQNSVYIRVKDNTTSRQYEGNIDERTVKLQFSLNEIYKLIITTFEQQITNEDETEEERNQDFNVDFVVKTNVLELVFNLVLHSIVKINFTILLKEKIISGNEEATLILNGIEENFNKEISLLKKKYQEIDETNKQLMKFIEKVSFSEISIASYTSHSYGASSISKLYYPINSNDLLIKFDINEIGGLYRFGLFYDEKLKLFYQLKKITFEHYVYPDFTKLSNDSIEELTIKPSGGGNANLLTSINGINNFRNLKNLHLEQCTNLKDVYISLSNIKHNIKQLTFIGCTNIDQQNLKLYCEQNKIHLQIT